MPIRRRAAIVLASIAALAAASMPLLDSVPAHAGSFHLSPMQRRLASTALLNILATPSNTATITGDNPGDGADGAPNGAPAGFTVTGPAGRPANYFPAATTGCSTNFAGNIKVNTNCLNVTDPDLQGRAQANNETAIAQDPMQPTRLVASNNDYVRGDGTCGSSYSTTAGATWNNSTVPDIFTRGLGGNARQYWGGGGDTSVAWDTKGNAYLNCQVFNRGTPVSQNPDLSSAFIVFRSTGNGGASWNFPGRYVEKSYDYKGTGVPPFEDKQYMTIDTHLGSPFQDRIYVSWTEFTSTGSAYIWEAYSKDYGETFSPRVLVSGGIPLCTNPGTGATNFGKCNANQFSDPFTGPDGSLYVAFANFNNTVTGADNRNQIFLAKSTDGGASFSLPVKVSDYYDLPHCDTYQGAGADPARSCVPEKGPSTRSVFRAANYPSGAVNPVTGQVVVTFGSYINAVSKESNGCVPDGLTADGYNKYVGVKTVGACNNKILISTSSDGGATFTDTATDPRDSVMVTQAPGQVGTDQWFQWAAINKTGNLAVSYYDRQYGDDELTGYQDFSISGSRDMVNFGQSRVTTASMPPPTQFPSSKGGVFWGDYTGLAYVGSIAYPIWSDTRPRDVFVCPGTATGPGNPPTLCSGVHSNGVVANDQDIYTALVVPRIR